jgi:WD40 repeat protein
MQIFLVSLSESFGMLYTGSDDGHIKLYDIANATLLATLSGHTSWVLSVAFRCVNPLQLHRYF